MIFTQEDFYIIPHVLSSRLLVLHLLMPLQVFYLVLVLAPIVTKGVLIITEVKSR